MSLFTKKEDADNKWEKKYFSLLDEHDSLEKSSQETEQLLCKTIMRLALAATGFNQQLDPYLNRIRKQLKKGLNNHLLKQELEEFSNALMQLDESSSQKTKPDPSLLFKFLARHYTHRRAELEHICKEYQRNAKIGVKDLLLALHELIDEESSVVSEIHNHNVDQEAIRVQVLELLKNTDIPNHFKQRAEKLKNSIDDPSESLNKILQDTFDLLIGIKKDMQSKQDEMADFLSNLTEHLLSLAQNSQQALIMDKSFESERKVREQVITEQIQELKNNSISATELEPLKNMVISHLDDIGNQWQENQQKNLQHGEKTRESITELSKKIRQLESESKSLKNSLQKVQKQATRDPLTGLPNRIAYEERLQAELARMQRNGTPLAMAIWDIDFFKKINDTYGHKAGDKTLVIIANLLADNCRAVDFVSRFGGEEFTMLLAETNAQSALIIADKLRRKIADAGFNAGGNKIQITISCGISEFGPDDTGETVFVRADEALYQAKKNGRNQCVVG